MSELWYSIRRLPDLTLNKYSSLEENGVDGVLEKHSAFLRQLNRKGILSGLSYHLYYLYLRPEKAELDTPGQRLKIFLEVRGNADSMENVPAMIEASPLAEFFTFESEMGKGENAEKPSEAVSRLLKKGGADTPVFNTCCVLTKSETVISTGAGEGDEYYMIRDWEMNEDGRLYNMCRMMDELNRKARKTVLFRVDLYPVERSQALREALRKPMSILRRRQDDRTDARRRDYDGKDALENYEDLIERFDSSPHFIANIMTFANSKEDAASVLDAAGAESLSKGKYTIASFSSVFHPDSFIGEQIKQLENIREHMLLRQGKSGLIVCREDTANINLNYLPSLFSLEEIAPFFRFPALYDGEVIQIPKETAPPTVPKNGALYLGKDGNKYDVNYPLSLLPKHAFIAGVPGSGKTNTMHHITSTLWKEHRIPFLVLEPAKQEYRALINDPEMKGMYLFSPNADMSFPLHINPFEMPKGTLVAEHIRRLCSVFEGAFPLEPPMPFLLDTAIEAVYRELGWIPEHIYKGDEKQRDGKTLRPLPTMSMLYKRLEQELKSTQYSDEVRGNLESALKVRIGSLLRREMGDVFDVPRSSFTPEQWLQVPAVIELESMGSGPANFLTLMLCSLIRETLKVDPHREQDSVHITADRQGRAVFDYSCPDAEQTTGHFEVPFSGLTVLKNGSADWQPLGLKSTDGSSHLTFRSDGRYEFFCSKAGVRSMGSYSFNETELTLIRGNKDVRHVILIEEAHNLIGPESEEQTGADANPKIAATAFIVKMLAEVRALKESIIIADQLPTVMAQEVLKNTGLKIGMRITSADDRALLGGTMAASGLQLEQMATFEVGEALIFYEKLKRPFTMRITEWCGELDKKEKIERTTPKSNDGELRRQLSRSGNAEYKEENVTSISIIGKKYFALLNDMKKRIAPLEVWLSSMAKLKADIDTLQELFMRVSMGQYTLSEDKKQEKYDMQELLKRQYNAELGKRERMNEILDIIQAGCNYFFTLERLKNGRWTRFSAPEKLIAEISALQLEIADETLRIYGLLKKALGKSCKIGPLGDDVEELRRLADEIDEDLMSYAAHSGSEEE